jgi:hypothetical protein
VAAAVQEVTEVVVVVVEYCTTVLCQLHLVQE